MTCKRLLFVVGIGLCLLPIVDSEVFCQTPLRQAHAHNDYYHKRPLLDALDAGFCSFEADVFLVKGELLVGHNMFELRPKKTLRSLYLDPLKQRIQAQDGRVYEAIPTIVLLVDIKTKGEAVYEVLHRQLADYRELLTRIEDGRLVKGPIEVIISGDRPVQTVREQQSRFVGIDGRISDLASDVDTNLMPLISDNWQNHFKWRGEGPMPEAERQHLRAIVKTAHRQNKRLRFWATPEKESVWRELYAADVDLIGTDELSRLQRFLTDRAAQPKDDTGK